MQFHYWKTKKNIICTLQELYRSVLMFRTASHEKDEYQAIIEEQKKINEEFMLRQKEVPKIQRGIENRNLLCDTRMQEHTSCTMRLGKLMETESERWRKRQRKIL